jgi:hypothetical protein
MNLGDALRDTLSQEADVQTPAPPDVDVLIHGGRVRRRRRNITRIGLTATTVVLAVGVAYGASQVDPGGPRSDPGPATQPTQPTASGSDTNPPALATDPGPEDLEPGTYRVLVGADSTGAAIEADLTVEGPGWRSGDFPEVKAHRTHGGFGVYRPDALAAGSGCNGDLTNSNVGENPQALAAQLAQLPHSTVVQSPTQTQLSGHDALHLRLRITGGCPPDQWYRVAETPRGSRGVTYGDAPATAIIDFWIVELDGVPVVVDHWYQQGASADLVDRIVQARDSITFVNRG